MQNQMQTQVRDQNSKLRKFKKADRRHFEFFYYISSRFTH